MSAIAAILLEAAGSLAVPVIKKILGDKIGGAGGELAGNVIDIIAGQAGVPVEKLPELKPAELDKAIVASEPMAVELLTLHVESQRLMNENLQAELDKGGPVWTWGWRPATMWLIAFLVVALCFYFGLLGWRGFGLIATGSVAGIGLGIGVILLPIIVATRVFRVDLFSSRA